MEGASRTILEVGIRSLSFVVAVRQFEQGRSEVVVAVPSAALIVDGIVDADESAIAIPALAAEIFVPSFGTAFYASSVSSSVCEWSCSCRLTIAAALAAELGKFSQK